MSMLKHKHKVHVQYNALTCKLTASAFVKNVLKVTISVLTVERVKYAEVDNAEMFRFDPLTI